MISNKLTLMETESFAVLDMPRQADDSTPASKDEPLAIAEFETSETESMVSAVEDLKCRSIALWSKSMEFLTASVSESSSISDVLQILHSLLELASPHEELLSALMIIIEQFCEQVIGRKSDRKNGILLVLECIEKEALPIYTVQSKGSPKVTKMVKKLNQILLNTSSLLNNVGNRKYRKYAKLNSDIVIPPEDSAVKTEDLMSYIVSNTEIDPTVEFFLGNIPRYIDSALSNPVSRTISIDAIRDRLNSVLAPLFSEEVVLDIFGSTLTGLTYANSDVDMVLLYAVPPAHHVEYTTNKNKILDEIEDLESQVIEFKNEEMSFTLLKRCFTTIQSILAPEIQLKSTSYWICSRCQYDNKPVNIDCRKCKTLRSADLHETTPKADSGVESSTTGLNLCRFLSEVMDNQLEYLNSLRAQYSVILDRLSSLRDQLEVLDNINFQRKNKLLNQVAKSLWRRNYVDVHPVSRARVAVIKFVDGVSKRHCDLVINSPLGLHNSRMFREYLNIDESGKVKLFFMLIKLFAKINKLNDASEGHLSSYAWVVMGFHILLRYNLIPNFQSSNICQGRERVICEGIDVTFCIPSRDYLLHFERNLENISISQLLILFFNYFVEHFDVESNVVTMRDFGETIPKSCWRRCPSWRFSIEDPFERADSSWPHDLGSTLSAGGQLKIFRALKQVSEILQSLLSHKESTSETCISKWERIFHEAMTDKNSSANAKSINSKERNNAGKKRQESKKRIDIQSEGLKAIVTSDSAEKVANEKKSVRNQESLVTSDAVEKAANEKNPVGNQESVLLVSSDKLQWDRNVKQVEANGYHHAKITESAIIRDNKGVKKQGKGANVEILKKPLIRICFEFQKGQCKRGDKCKYLHDMKGSGGGAGK